MLRAHRSLTLVSALLLLTAVASAQPKKRGLRDELPAQAQSAWDAGMTIINAGTPDWDKAAASFQEAYDISKNPRVLYNIAVCERNMEHFARAIAKFKQELAEGAQRLTPKEKSEIQASIDALGRYVSTIELAVNEPDAVVYLDDIKVGQSPMGPVPADISLKAPHRIRVEKEGFETFERRDVMVPTSAPVKVAVELEPKIKKTEIEVAVTGAPGASIFVDGIDRGPAPFKGLVEAGAHTFEARQPGYETTSRREEIVYKQKLRISIPLEKAITTGHLRIDTVEGASLELDGKLVGTTAWEGTIEAGTHTVSARKDGFNEGKMEVYLPKGETVSRRLSLTHEKKNEWVFWTVGTVVVVAGIATVAALVYAPKDQSPVIGTFDPGLVKAGHGFRF